MITPKKPNNEKERLAALKKYNILDTSPEVFFDDLTFLASEIFNTPLAFVTFLDERYLWFKSNFGFEVTEVPRDIAFCTHTVSQGEFFEIPDTLADARFVNNFHVTHEPYVRFYAGMPITTPEGYHIGTFCVLDKQPRLLNSKQREALKRLAKQVMLQIEQQQVQKTIVHLNAQLAEKVEFIENLTNSIPAVIGYWDQNLICQFANAHYQTFLEIDPKSLIGRHYLEAFPQPFLDEAYPKLLNVLKGERQTFEIAKEWPIVGMRYGIVNYIPDVDKNGQVKGIFSLAFDVTTVKNTETKLKLSEKALQSTHEGIFITDELQRIIYINDGFTIITGYADSEALGNSANLLESDQQHDDFFNKIYQKIKTLGSFQDEITFQKKNGDQFIALLTIDLIKDEVGNITNYVASFIDVTNNNKTKDALALTTSMLQRTGEMAKIGGWECNCLTNKITWSDEIFRIHEIESKEIPPLDEAMTFYPSEAKTALLNAMNLCIEQHTPWDLELPFITAKGNHRWVRSQGQAQLLHGKVIKLVGAFQDITERKQQEQQRLTKEVNLRNTLVREVHHRIKNNLQGVSGILHNFTVNQPLLKEPMAAAISQLQSVAVIHGLQGKSSQGKIELSELTSEIIHQIKNIWQIECTLKVIEDWRSSVITKAESVPIALILNELITNAIKHKELGSHVNINLTQKILPEAGTSRIVNKVTIINKGVFRDKSPQEFSLVSHSGLNLVTSLMPKNGAYLHWEFGKNTTCVQLELAYPIVKFEDVNLDFL